MTRLQVIRDEIARLQTQLSLLRSSQENLNRVVRLEIAEPKMREWADNQLHINQREIDSVITVMLDAEAEEHQLTSPRMQRQYAGR